LGDVGVAFFFHQSQASYQPVFCWKLMESPVDAVASLSADGAIRGWRAREILGKRGFLPGVTQMVERRVGGDSTRPSAEIAVRFALGSVFVNAPERVHG
jgi:hypothetical protein